MLGLVLGQIDGRVKQRLVVDNPVRLDAAGSGDHRLGFGVVDPGGQLARGETAEHHRVDGADPGAAEHGDGGFRHHRHIDDDPIALGHAECQQGPGEARDLILQLRIGDHRLGAGDGAVVNDGGLVAPTGGDMPIHGVVTGVQHPAREPAMEGRIGAVQDLVPRPIPVDKLCGLGPE